MIYFDTDVLIHMLVPQDLTKHEMARSCFEEATQAQNFFISLLCLQETAYVLQKLGQKTSDIEATIKGFLNFQPVSYQIGDVRRGVALAKLIGFQNVNDCIHLAVAETHCSQFVTFNKTDFVRLKKHTLLDITIL